MTQQRMFDKRTWPAVSAALKFEGAYSLTQECSHPWILVSNDGVRDAVKTVWQYPYWGQAEVYSIDIGDRTHYLVFGSKRLSNSKKRLFWVDGDEQKIIDTCMVRAADTARRSVWRVAWELEPEKFPFVVLPFFGCVFIYLGSQLFKFGMADPLVVHLFVPIGIVGFIFGALAILAFPLTGFYRRWILKRALNAHFPPFAISRP